MKKTSDLPELLAPVGSPEALLAAIAAGADAVYFGGNTFNARLRAHNFDDEAVAKAIALCHAHGVKAYMTFNTLVTDRELPDFLAAAEKAYHAGVDALIVADLGAATLIHKAMPDLQLHASTQCSIHNTEGVRALAARGFCRVVPARELPAEEIALLAQKSGTEIEIFIHGALCVSHSGQCLFSSLVGGRSGNRGECAQPCRLPDAKGKYPLSLKDLCLAREIPFFIEKGVHSLKIEGRLKSPTYVYEVVSIYRRLLDERRAATDREIAALDAIFSRSGFTDGYFKEKIGHKMLGVRTESDKKKATERTFTEADLPALPLDLDFVMKSGEPIALTLTNGAKTATVTGDIPLVAQNAPMDAEAVKKNLCRFGGTPYTVRNAQIEVESGLMIPVSRLNALRRAALAALTNEPVRPTALSVEPHSPTGAKIATPSARFESPDGITPAAQQYFPIRYLPLHRFEEAEAGLANGVVIPPVIFDREVEKVTLLLQKAAERGAKHALVGNVGHLPLAIGAGLIPHGDFRLNVTNGTSLSALLGMGFADVLLSPELTLPQIRDIKGSCDAIVYGRIPLMLLEKCAGLEVGSCALCAEGKNGLTDRRGEKFPIFMLPTQCRDGHHRNLLYNSRPTAMSDRRRDLLGAGLTGGHYVFTTESPAEVDRILEAYQKGSPLGDKVRRI